VKHETEMWPFVKARWFTDLPDTDRKVRVIVIHDMEAPELVKTAENVANWFKNHPGPREKGASAHVCVDSDSVIQCVYDSDVAWAAPGANNDGIQIELAGYGSQTAEQWQDEYSKALLDRGADVAAQYCLKYDIPARHITNDELRLGHKGIVGHYQVSAVYKLSDHTDPGPNFPWPLFIEQVIKAVERRQ
jgi:N-acetyl-anhydromuramyl-L-alanine amidase AmpD